jgi:hypothetical protein
LKNLLTVVALSVLSPWPCLADAVEAKQFAYAVALTPDRPFSARAPNGAIHGYTLPESVLRTLTDAELGDLCVFDAQGVQRPLALHIPRDVAGEHVEVPLAFFPLTAPPANAATGTEVQVERDPTGTITRAFSRSIDGHDTRLSALIDTSAIIDPILGLNLALSGARDFTIEVRVESSDDLSQFAELTTATVAHLEHGGHTLSRDLVELPSVHARYLRLTIKRPPGSPTLALDSLQARVARPGSAPTRSFVALSPHEATGKEGQVFAYTLPGVFRVDRYTVVLPAATPLAEVTLLSSGNAKAAFRVLDRALFRAVPEERELTRTDDDFYELRVSDKGGGIRGGTPTLKLGYLAPRLLFAGDDAAPYVLAYGSAQARCKRFDEDELLSIASVAAGYVSDGDTVQAGPVQTLAGKPALLPAEKPRPLRLYALWAVLVLAVGVLAYVTRKLLRSAG